MEQNGTELNGTEHNRADWNGTDRKGNKKKSSKIKKSYQIKEQKQDKNHLHYEIEPNHVINVSLKVRLNDDHQMLKCQLFDLSTYALLFLF